MQKSTTNLERITRFYEWMNTRSDVEIVKFQIDSNLLFDIHAQRYPKHMGKYHNALIEGITSVIDIYLSVSDSLKEQYHSGKLKREDESNISFPDADTNAYELYRILKIQWLYESIKGDCQHAPVQIMKRKNSSYRFHPGSDKTTSLYLLGKTTNKKINVFYIWYKDLDPTPFHHTLEYEVVKTPQEFANMFVKFNDPRFRIIEDSVKVDTHHMEFTEPHFTVFCENVQDALGDSKHNCNEIFDRRHISYNDTVHHDGISINMDEIFKFKHSIEDGLESFTFPNGLKFVKVKPTWDWQDYYWVHESDVE